jgi:hypothetical protein
VSSLIHAESPLLDCDYLLADQRNPSSVQFGKQQEMGAYRLFPSTAHLINFNAICSTRDGAAVTRPSCDAYFYCITRQVLPPVGVRTRRADHRISLAHKLKLCEGHFSVFKDNRPS